VTITVQPLTQPRLIANTLFPILERRLRAPGSSATALDEIRELLKTVHQENVILMRCRQEEREGDLVLVSQEQAGQRRGVEKVGPDEHDMTMHVVDAAEEEGWTHIITNDAWIYFYKLVDRDDVSALND